MHVCLVSTEFFDRGVFGGFGRAVRVIGSELVARGARVTAIVPARAGAPRDQVVDGVRLREFPRWSPAAAFRLFRDADADLYHSQDPSLWTWVAQRAAPQRRHVITFRDPRTLGEWAAEWRSGGFRNPAWLGYPLIVDGPLTFRAARRADAHFVTAHFLARKVQLKYRLDEPPAFLPTPLRISSDTTAKSVTPLVCFVGRLDRRKRPELFFELARRCPDVRFVAVGYAPDPRREARLRSAAAAIPNLTLGDPIDQFRSDELFRLLGESWVIVNTSVIEALPTTFLEAAAHGCAILGFHDPDGFATRFGYMARDMDDLVHGLRHLIQAARWEELGAQAREYTTVTYGAEAAVDAHLRAYEACL